MDRAGEVREGSGDATLVEAAEGAPAAFYQFRLSPSGTFALPYVSPAFVARYGIEEGQPEETAARFLSRVHPDDLNPLREAIGTSAMKLEAFAADFRFRDASGAEVWVEARSNPRRTPDGGVLWNGIATDITARRIAEAALRESEARLRLFVRHAPAALAMFDRSMRYVTASSRWLADYGLGDRDVTGLSHYAVLPEIPERWKEAHRRGLAGEIVRAEDDPFERADGTIQWIRWEIRPWRTGDGDLGGIVIFAEDITDRRKAAKALRESEERFRAMFDVAPVGIAQAQPATGRWVSVNPRMCLITGYTAEELLAMRVPELTHPEDRDRDWQLFQDVVSGKAPEYRLEKRYVRKDGSIAWVNVNMVVLRDASGLPTRTLAMIEDITERKKAETKVERLNADLEEALAWQQQIFEGSRDAVFLSDEAGRFVAVNVAATELTGFTREELLRMKISDLHDEPDLAAFRAFNRRILDGERILSSAPIRRKDGRKVAAEFNNSRIIVGEKRFMHTAARDTTERGRLEEQFRQAQKMEAVGQLAGGVAHDFNNLLTVISGNSDLLLSGIPADDPKRAALADIHAAGERAADLTRQLLAFSRKQILEPKLVDVHEVVTGIEKMLRRLIGEDVDLLTDLAADPSWVRVDRGQLEQVILNLAVNARDAMPRGGRITIRTRNIDPKKPVDLEETPGKLPRPRVALSISDTGSGIAPEIKPHLFEPFFTTKAVGKGTGLGLATVYGIVKQSGGEVIVESEPDEGATFTIVLPSQPAPRGAHVASGSQRVFPRGTETVLVVEDEDAVRRIVKIALESTGYRVFEARNGREALELARKHTGTIHILVTDVVMPEMSGRELAERIAQDHADVKILYMSGYTDDAVVRHGIVESGVAFLQKPFSPLALARKVREVLDPQA